jgi:hypothetical protein
VCTFYLTLKENIMTGPTLKPVYLSVVFSSLLLMVFVSELNAQERGNQQARTSPNASVSQTIGTTVVELAYGRPSVNERQIFGSLVPLGQVWRTGANEATSVTFSDDVLLEGNPVEAGTYSLYTEPGEDEWTIIINNNINWGTRYDESADVLRFSVTPVKASFVEQMMIYFEDVTSSTANLVIHWDVVKVPIEIQVD